MKKMKMKKKKKKKKENRSVNKYDASGVNQLTCQERGKKYTRQTGQIFAI